MPELIATFVNSLGRLITVSSHCSTLHLLELQSVGANLGQTASQIQGKPTFSGLGGGAVCARAQYDEDKSSACSRCLFSR